jgi:hypothetical protein
MRKFVSIGLASALALATLASTAAPAGANHRNHRDGITFGFSFGTPHGYGYPAYRPYRPYRHAYPVAPRRQYRGGWSAHVAWCYDRYRSYRASDNTYQPYRAPRRECRSPYWG